MEQEKYTESALNNSSTTFNTIHRSYDHEISSDFHTDSAYSSGYNLSTCDTPNTSHNIGLEISTPHLKIIHEPSNDLMKLTPVTQNICRIFNFHITTPKSIDFNKKQTVGVKRSSQFNLRSTPKKIKLITESDQENLSYISKTPSKPIQKKQPLSENKQNVFERLNASAYSKDNSSIVKYDNQFNYENRLPTITENQSNKTNSIKKLLKCSNDEFEAILKTTPRKEGSFQDYRSSYSIKSAYNLEKKNRSDIKTSFCRTLSFATSPIPDTNTFRSTASTDALDTSLEICETRKQLNISQGSTDMEISPLPAMRFHKANSYFKTDKIIENVHFDSENLPVTPMKRKIFADDSDIKTSFCRTLSFATSPIPDTNTFRSTASTDALDTSLLNISQGSTDMEIIPLPAMRFHKANSYFKTDKIIENVHFDSENIPVTPMKRKISADDIFNEQSSYPHTPKKIKYQFSPKLLNSTQFKKYVTENSKNPIVTNFRTPTKFNSKKHQNLRLHQQKTKTGFDCQLRNLNILEKLSQYPILIDNIFSHLSSYDLLNLKRVSRSFSNIINNQRRIKLRIENFISDYKICKENFNEKEFDKVKDKLLDAQIIHADKKFDKKVPFSNNNSECRQKLCLDGEEQEQPTKIKGFKSPNVSPSKRKFYENQKVVNTLSQKQHCVRCPRCNKPSRAIITQDEINSKMKTEISSILSDSHYKKPASNFNRNSICIMDSTQFQPLLKKKLIKTVSADSGLHMKKSARQSSPTNTFQPYGECTALSCNFKFCLKCLCEYHPGKLCVLELDIGSPKKDDSSEKLGSKSNRSFKRRKSLKRLCF